MAWTEDKENRLRKLWGKVTTSRIAKELGMTKNAVVGKAHRMHLVEPSRPAPKKLTPKERSQRANNTSRVLHRVRKRIANEPDLPPVTIVHQNVEDDFKIPVAQRRTVLTLTSRCCHWPVGDPRSPDFFYCGGDNVPGSAYCASHKRRLQAQAQEGSTPSTGWVAHKPLPVVRKAGMR